MANIDGIFFEMLEATAKGRLLSRGRPTAAGLKLVEDWSCGTQSREENNGSSFPLECKP